VVTAYRAPLAQQASPASTRVLSAEELTEASSPVLDNKLRLVPGVELFRRSSSLVANPTSQGLSLRGLGSTAASRTLVVAEDVPLNDPYGGWIHWNELPELSLNSVEVVRGGASDLYGSSAIGGVVNMMLERPELNSVRFTSSYGGENTSDNSVLASTVRGRWSGLASGGILRTDGYTLIAPAARGPVDVPSNVHFQNGLLEVERKLPASGRLFLRGSALNEARSNGTPLQTNATRLWRYSLGGDLAILDRGVLAVRLFGDEEHYRQSFSAIGAGRATESLARLARTPAAELGASAHWSESLQPQLVLLIGADTHDVRATDVERSLQRGQPSGFLDVSARQRQTGVYGELLWTPAQWTLSVAGRVDHFSNFDAVQWTGLAPVATTPPNLAETVFDPRVGIARQITQHLSLAASAFRAYRAPTQNELYRTGQVGQETTLPNPALRSERATGWEAGFQTTLRNSVLRTSYFWTQVNRPITALTLSVTPGQILDQRQNLGQIESRGVAVDFQSQPVSWLGFIGGYQYSDAAVTQFRPQPALVGNWIPQVARNTATAQIRLTQRRWGTLSLQGRLSGRQFDDASNNFLLHGYFRMDAYASRDLGRHLSLFASAENLFDRTNEVGRTPTLTLGTPLVGRAGLRVRLGE
jgi:outer membrane receptor protein involved in Fe transport